MADDDVPLPNVTGISPKEGPPRTKVTIRGENLGQDAEDLLGEALACFLRNRVVEAINKPESSLM